MKKVLFLAVVSLAAASCLKNEAFVVETPQELTFKAVSNVATKADAQLEGTLLNKDYRIYASATQRKADGTIENASYFTDKTFATDTTIAIDANSKYHAMELISGEWQVSPIYWPLGGCEVDYIAYAMPSKVHDANPALENGPVATYINEATDVASHLEFEGWNTYDHQVDVLYAVKNGANTTDHAGSLQTLPLTFNHAQALLVFKAKVNTANVMQINEIKIVGLEVKGNFVVDNTRNSLVAEWTSLKTEDGKDVVAAGADDKNDNLHLYNADEPKDATSEYLDNTDEFEQVGSSLLIPQQSARNFVVTYHISGKEMKYEYNHSRAAWEMGKKYVYNLDFKLNEVVITESVEDFVLDEETITLK